MIRFLLAAMTCLITLDLLAEKPLLINEGPLADGPSYSAYLLSYQHDELNLHAMVAVPSNEMPPDGYPVVIANHGYVPNPAKYGITAEGVDSRPGDYYRSVPELYTSRGFLVVLPDYRGHNSSEGLEFVHKPDSVDHYAADVVALMSGLHEIEHADIDNVFLWSHSMGGGVSIRAQLDTDIVRGASYWATMSVDDQAERFSDLGAEIIIQHSSGDESTDHSNSASFRNALNDIEYPVTLHTYKGSNHYFEGHEREQAADRDVALFRALMQ